MKENENVIGYVEISKDYWVITTTTDVDVIDNPNKHWHGNDDD